jgi:hypothetical protein
MGEILNEHRGGSGAIIDVYGDGGIGQRVRKAGTERVGLEGRWLKANSAPGIIKVFDVWDTGYTMERLTPHPGFLTVFEYTDAVLPILALDVWTRPAQVIMHGPNVHRDRMQPLLPHLGSHTIQFVQMYHSIPWHNLILCRTHGDPIADNVMQRGADNVLIDPIPATPAIPDYLAVDVGRIIQSAVGYEKARYGVGFVPCARIDTFIELSYSVMNHRLHKHEYLACYYFAVFHMLRACVDRRATPEIQAALYPLITRIMKEAEGWMSSYSLADVAAG